MTTTDTAYNGWTNYETWNIALWISNDEPLYRAAVDFMRRYPRKGKAPYLTFIRILGLVGCKTPDRVAWLGRKLDYAALNEMMREFGEVDA